MGTRNLTIVKADKETKIVQYGQWDGYPTGQGQGIADFLKTVDLKKFKKQVLALKKFTRKAIDKAYTDAGWDGKSQFVSCDISDKVKEAYPALSRDTASEILALVHEGKVKKVQFCSDYDIKTGKVAEDTWCEYWYEIDLDKETITVNSGETYTFKQWIQKGFLEKLDKKMNK